MDVEIRPCRSGDCDCVAELILHAYAPGIAADDPYRADLADVAGRMNDAQVLVACRAGQPVGTVSCCPFGSLHSEIARAGENELRMLAVAPQWQGQGIGRLLLQAAIAQTRTAGLDAVVLSSSAWMQAAHHLYATLGFVRTPERDWQPRADVRLMTYRLPLSK